MNLSPSALVLIGLLVAAWTVVAGWMVLAARSKERSLETDKRTARRLERMVDESPAVPLLVRAAGGLATGTAATTAPSVTWSPNVNNLTAELVKQSQALGLQVVPWTVNDPVQMQHLIEWGVDGIITDYPDRLREVMAQKGLVLPVAVMP